MIIKCVKIYRGKQYYVQAMWQIAEAIFGEFDGKQPGDRIVLEYCEITEEEYISKGKIEGERAKDERLANFFSYFWMRT